MSNLVGRTYDAQATFRDMYACEAPTEWTPMGPKFPEGTPEYEEYAKKLRAELAKFVAGEPPYDGGL